MHWSVEDSSTPPSGIASSEVEGDFSASGEGFTELVTGHEEPFAVLPPGCVKFRLLSVRPISFESSLTGPSQLFPLQYLE